MSLASGLVRQLVAKGLLTRTDALDLYESLASVKEATSDLYGIDDEKEAAQVLRYLAEKLRERP